MASINPINVLLLLLDHYKPRYPEDSPVNEDELSLKESLQDTIDTFVVSAPPVRRTKLSSAIASNDIIVKFQPVNVINVEEDKTEESSEDDEDDDSEISDDESDEEHQSSLDEDEEEQEEADPTFPEPDALPPRSSHRDDVSFEYKKRAVEYWLDSKRKKIKRTSSVISRFKLARNDDTLQRWRRQVQAGGTRQDKVKQLFVKTVELVRAAKERGESITSSAIKKLALEANEANVDLKIVGFVASIPWITQFRKDCPDGLIKQRTQMTRAKGAKKEWRCD